jgi:hypothetical protein
MSFFRVLIILFSIFCSSTSFAAELPSNAIPRAYGSGWDCEKGYFKSGQKCNLVTIPTNGKLNYLGNGWDCEKGYFKSGQKCNLVTIPTNGKLNYLGNGWDCEKGFKKQKNICEQMTPEEIIKAEMIKAEIMKKYQNRKVSGVSGDDCDNEYKTNAEVCVNIENLNIDCQKDWEGKYYRSCDVSLDYEVETDYEGGAYLDVDVECTVEIEYKGRNTYSTKSDSSSDEESHDLYAHDSDSESMDFNFTFSSYDEITSAKVSSATCEIDSIDLY